MIATTRATYDGIGAAYATVNRELPETVVASMERFVASLPAGGVVADVGCGPGRDLAALRDRGLRAFGFDLSTGMLRAARSGGLVCADMTRLPIRDRSLDGVWCAASFLHVPRELSLATIRGFAQVLRPRGVLHLSVAEGRREGIEQASLGDHDELWVVQRTEDEIRSALSAAGFVVISVDRSASHRRWLTIGARLG